MIHKTQLNLGCCHPEHNGDRMVDLLCRLPELINELSALEQLGMLGCEWTVKAIKEEDEKYDRNVYKYLLDVSTSFLGPKNKLTKVIKQYKGVKP